MKLQRPILVGGLGLSFSLWILQSWHHSIMQVGEFSLLSLLAVGGGLWLLKQNSTKNSREQIDGTPVDRATVARAIARAEAVVNQLSQESQNHVETRNFASLLREKVAHLTTELDRKEIKLAVTGGKSVGKSTLIQVLGQQNVETLHATSLQETPPLFVEGGEKSDAAAMSIATAADFVLFLTNGDLTDTEFQTLQQLKAANQQLMLVFNKQDQYLPDERASVLNQLQQRMPNVVATAASPRTIKVRKHLEDGSIQEWQETPAPDIQQLTSQLGDILAHQRQQLVWATTVRSAQLLKSSAKDLLNQVRRDRATPVIEQYQWIAFSAAFANPVPALDIVATAAINAQMVMDLGGIYQQKFSREQAQTVAGTMGSLMLKLGLVELSTKAISTVLKTNAVTFVAGGVVQGISAAYLTRIAGLSLVEYFQQQEVAIDSGSAINLDKLKQTLQNVFGHEQIGLLPTFVKQGVKRLLPTAESELVGIQKTVG